MGDNPRRASSFLVAAALALTACDLGEEPPPESTDPETTETAEAPSDDGEAPEPEEAAPVTEVEETAPRFAFPDATAIELTTPGAGEGAWPVLEWDPVDDAATYSVTLYASSGEAYWRWRGETTQVRVGGFPEQPPEGSSLGPKVHEAMTWEVIARDANGSVIAQSGERPISS